MQNVYNAGGVLLLVRPPDVSREGLKFYPWTFFSFLSSFINSPRSAAT